MQESGSGSNDITDIRIINHGGGYNALPTLTISSSSGSGATILAKGSEIGKVLTTRFTDLSVNYQESTNTTYFEFYTKFIIERC